MIYSLGLFYLFYFALVAVYIIFMPKALIEFGYTNQQVGIIFAGAPFMRFLLPFIFKKYIELTHSIFIKSLILTFIGTILIYYFIDNFWLYLIANLIFGGAMGVSLPFVETVALSYLSKNRYGKVRLYGSIGFMAISLWLGKMLSDNIQVFYYLSAMSFFTLLMGYFVSKFDKNISSDIVKEKNDSFSLLKYPYFWTSIFLMQVGFGGFYNFFTIYESSNGISLETISWLWSFGVICEIVMLYFQGPLLKRNLLSILKFATLITALRWLILYLYPDSLMITFISQSLHAVSFALYHTTAITYIFILYTQKRLAQQFFLGIAFGLGGSVGAMLSGVIYGDSMFLIEAIITLLAFAILFLHERRKDNEKDI